jgi:hydroxypyruvate reductase
MTRTARQLRDDALAIWHAGVQAVDSRRLILDNVQIEGEHLVVDDECFDLEHVRRLVVVGAGKAGAGMSRGLEEVLGDRWLDGDVVSGWINVPADCVGPLRRIVLHPARPAGVNEPTDAGVVGTHRILNLVESLRPEDLCICLLSGGGSALLPLPIEGVSLADKQAITTFLSAAGANIQELNTVRKQLSLIKGGGLANACRARIVTLIISDVIGDPLDVIASGPTIANSTTATDALAVLDKFVTDRSQIPIGIWKALERQAGQATVASEFSHVSHFVIGNNSVAVDAAGMEAERRGYSHAMVVASGLEGQAEAIGEHLADMAISMRDEPGPDCLITGGEPVVQLVPCEQRGLGGRNQQLVLAALARLLAQSESPNQLTDIALLAGGTDGEDGPTDAAGALIDVEIVETMHGLQLDPAMYLANNDAYHFFQQLAGLIQTGPTHTNVCDLRVVTVSQPPVDS